MTRIALLLTAIPLAAFLATLLNALLDRQFATTRPRPTIRTPSGRALLLVLTLAPFAAHAAHAASPEAKDAADCQAIDCSLEVDADAVETLWGASASGVELVSQSRIPVDFYAPSGLATERTPAVLARPAPTRKRAADPAEIVAPE